MSEYQLLGRIALTEHEEALYNQLPPRIPDHVRDISTWAPISVVVAELFRSIKTRDAIPDRRWKLFADGNYAERRGDSILSQFEAHNSATEILHHPEFLEWVHVFIVGSSLPIELQVAFCKHMNDFFGGESAERRARHRLVKDGVQQYALDPSDAGTEFFRLGVDIGMRTDEARGLRLAAREVGYRKRR